jgi:hypothetical protein
MSTPAEALHAIRNDLTQILFCAELAHDGDRDAQNLVINELVRRSSAIQQELDILSIAVHTRRAGDL